MAALIAGIHPIDCDHMEVNVESKRRVKALYERDRSALRSLSCPKVSRLLDHVLEDCFGEAVQNAGNQRGIVGEPVTERIWKRQHLTAVREPGGIHDPRGEPPYLPCAVRHIELQKPRRLQENGTTRSRPHPSQWTPTNPWANTPHSRNCRNSVSTKLGRARSRSLCRARNSSKWPATAAYIGLASEQRGR
jgi:hypothetical protein